MQTEDVNGVRISYEWAGTGMPPEEPVVLLNGIAMSIAHWKPVVDCMPGFRFLLHDFRGQLLSPLHDAARAISLEDHVDDLAALLRRLGVPRVHVVGTSYGAEVGMLFAAARPEMTASLAVIDGVSELDPLLAATARAWRTAALADPVVFYRSILPWNYSAEYIGANADALARREAAVASLPRGYFESFAALCDAFLDISITPRLGCITCRTLVVVGGKDILKHEGFARVIANGITGARLRVVPGAGHAVVIEKPAVIGGLLAPFLRGE